MKSIYLDYAAATPLNPLVLKAMQPYLAAKFYNPSATYLAAREVHRDLDKARHQIAMIIGARPAEIIFTAGATEANNLAIDGIMSLRAGAEVLASAIEHESILSPAKKFSAKQVPVDKTGKIQLDKLAELISPKTVLVSVMLVNNELGVVQPIKQIAELVKEVRAERLAKNNKLPIYLHTDAAQAGNWLDLHVSRLGIDLMTVSGAKIYGPKQTGALFVKAGVKLGAQIVGGGQESDLRAGTENVAGFIGLAKALELAQASRAQAAESTVKLRQNFIDQLQANLPRAIINGSPKFSAPHIISASFLGSDSERLMMQLDEAGIQVGLGSACSAASGEPSHVLRAIGLSDAAARSTLRFSFGRQTTQADIRHTISALIKLIA